MIIDIGLVGVLSTTSSSIATATAISISTAASVVVVSILSICLERSAW